MFKSKIKKINKVVITLLSIMFIISGSVFARTANDDPNKINTLLASDQNYRNWKKNLEIESGDNSLAFNIHYYGWHEGAKNMKIHMENLNNKVFHAGDTVTFSSWVKADNLSKSTGYTKITFDKDVKLKLFYTSHQKNTCKSRSCEEGSANSVFNSSGFNAGNIPVRNNSDYYGNVVIVYMLEDYSAPTPVNGGWTGWSINHYGNYGTCSNGTKTRNVYYTRSCTNPTPANGGADCSGSTTRTETQTVSCSTPIDGDWTGWTLTNTGSYGTCVNGTKSRTKTYSRTCTNPAPANGGADCSGSTTRTETQTVSCSTPTQSNGDVDTNNATNITKTSVKLNGDTNGTDVINTWFAFSRTDSTPSCNYSSQRVNSMGSENFYVYKNNLSCGETYYYRACGENGDNEVISGSIKEFTTDQCEIQEIDAQVTTNNATNIEKTSAQLNGYVDINDTKNGRVYFTYGTNPNYLVTNTGYSSVISDNTTFQSIVGLTPNTRYYYRAIVRDNNSIVDRGEIKTFVTLDNGTVIIPVNGQCSTYIKERCLKGNWSHIKDSSSQYLWRCNGYNTGSSVLCRLNKPTTKPNTNKPTTRPTQRPTTTSRPIEVVVVNETTTTVTKNYEEKGLKINKTVSTEKFGTYGLSTTAKIGDKVYYKIRVVNNSNKTIDNVEIKDFIPSELDLNGNSTNNVDKYATYIVNLNPGQSKTILTEMILSENTSEGDIIDSAAKITMDGVVEDTNSVSISVISNDNLNNLNTNNDDNRQGASIFGANSNFFPSSILGWMLLLILTLGIGLLFTKILTVNSNNRN